MPIPDDLELISGPIDSARHHSARTKARKAALDVLFEADLRRKPILDALAEHRGIADPPLRELTLQIVQGVAAHLGELDRLLAPHLAQGWTMDRMPRIDRALARMATWEVRFGDTPVQAVISEAVGLAEEYSTDESASFLNGLLGAALSGLSRATPDAISEPAETTD